MKVVYMTYIAYPLGALHVDAPIHYMEIWLTSIACNSQISNCILKLKFFWVSRLSTILNNGRFHSRGRPASDWPHYGQNLHSNYKAPWHLVKMNCQRQSQALVLTAIQSTTRMKPPIDSWKKLWKSAFVPNGVYSVFTEPFEIGFNRKVLFFHDHNSEGSFVGARVVKKSTEKVVEKSHLQGFPVGPMENPIDYRFVNGRFLTHHKMSRKWCQSKGG